MSATASSADIKDLKDKKDNVDNVDNIVQELDPRPDTQSTYQDTYQKAGLVNWLKTQIDLSSIDRIFKTKNSDMVTVLVDESETAQQLAQTLMAEMIKHGSLRDPAEFKAAIEIAQSLLKPKVAQQSIAQEVAKQTAAPEVVQQSASKEIAQQTAGPEFTQHFAPEVDKKEITEPSDRKESAEPSMVEKLTDMNLMDNSDIVDTAVYLSKIFDCLFGFKIDWEKNAIFQPHENPKIKTGRKIPVSTSSLDRNISYQIKLPFFGQEDAIKVLYSFVTRLQKGLNRENFPELFALFEAARKKEPHESHLPSLDEYISNCQEVPYDAREAFVIEYFPGFKMYYDRSKFYEIERQKTFVWLDHSRMAAGAGFTRILFFTMEFIEALRKIAERQGTEQQVDNLNQDLKEKSEFNDWLFKEILQLRSGVIVNDVRLCQTLLHIDPINNAKPKLNFGSPLCFGSTLALPIHLDIPQTLHKETILDVVLDLSVNKFDNEHYPFQKIDETKLANDILNAFIKILPEFLHSLARRPNHLVRIIGFNTECFELVPETTLTPQNICLFMDKLKDLKAEGEAHFRPVFKKLLEEYQENRNHLCLLVSRGGFNDKIPQNAGRFTCYKSNPDYHADKTLDLDLKNFKEALAALLASNNNKRFKTLALTLYENPKSISNKSSSLEQLKTIIACSEEGSQMTFCNIADLQNTWPQLILQPLNPMIENVSLKLDGESLSESVSVSLGSCVSNDPQVKMLFLPDKLLEHARKLQQNNRKLNVSAMVQISFGNAASTSMKMDLDLSELMAKARKPERVELILCSDQFMEQVYHQEGCQRLLHFNGLSYEKQIQILHKIYQLALNINVETLKLKTIQCIDECVDGWAAEIQSYYSGLPNCDKYFYLSDVPRHYSFNEQLGFLRDCLIEMRKLPNLCKKMERLTGSFGLEHYFQKIIRSIQFKQLFRQHFQVIDTKNISEKELLKDIPFRNGDSLVNIAVYLTGEGNYNIDGRGCQGILNHLSLEKIYAIFVALNEEWLSLQAQSNSNGSPNANVDIDTALSSAIKTLKIPTLLCQKVGVPYYNNFLVGDNNNFLALELQTKLDAIQGLMADTAHRSLFEDKAHCEFMENMQFEVWRQFKEQYYGAQYTVTYQKNGNYRAYKIVKAIKDEIMKMDANHAIRRKMINYIESTSQSKAGFGQGNIYYYWNIPFTDDQKSLFSLYDVAQIETKEEFDALTIEQQLSSYATVHKMRLLDPSFFMRYNTLFIQSCLLKETGLKGYSEFLQLPPGKQLEAYNALRKFLQDLPNEDEHKAPALVTINNVMSILWLKDALIQFANMDQEDFARQDANFRFEIFKKIVEKARKDSLDRDTLYETLFRQLLLEAKNSVLVIVLKPIRDSYQVKPKDAALAHLLPRTDKRRPKGLSFPLLTESLEHSDYDSYIEILTLALDVLKKKKLESKEWSEFEEAALNQIEKGIEYYQTEKTAQVQAIMEAEKRLQKQRQAAEPPENDANPGPFVGHAYGNDVRGAFNAAAGKQGAAARPVYKRRR